MGRKLSPGKLVIASHNAGKVREINALLSPFGLIAISVGELGLPVPEETESSFSGNAAIKAQAGAVASGLVSLSDDSGLEVMALNGAPGVYSADWAGTPRDFNRAMARVKSSLDEARTEDFSARFVCALCLAWPDGHSEVFEGEVRGELVFPPRGDQGFGYDPIFQPAGKDMTFGEMASEEKHAMSHRADAFRKLIKACLE